MNIIIIQIAVIAIVWTAGMYAINKVFGMILKHKDQIHLKFLKSMSKVLWSVLACITLSGLFTTTKTLSATLLTSSSLLVAIVGFAAQQVLADVISGIMLSWSRPFNVGEKINLSNLGISGIVEDMTVRHTIIRTYYNSRMIIPNSVINKEIVENSNYTNDYIGSYMAVPVSYESNTERAMAIMKEIIENHPLVLDIRQDKSVGNKVNVFVTELGESGIVIRATVWTKTPDDNFAACSDIRLELKKRFAQAGITIPYPHIHVVSDSAFQNVEGVV